MFVLSKKICGDSLARRFVLYRSVSSVYRHRFFFQPKMPRAKTQQTRQSSTPYDAHLSKKKMAGIIHKILLEWKDRLHRAVCSDDGNEWYKSLINYVTSSPSIDPRQIGDLLVVLCIRELTVQRSSTRCFSTVSMAMASIATGVSRAGDTSLSQIFGRDFMEVLSNEGCFGLERDDLVGYAESIVPRE